MKIVRFAAPEVPEAYGVIDGNTVLALKGTPFRSLDYSGKTYPLPSVRLLAPCAPSKIVCLGVNYHGHAKEMGHTLPTAPLIFLKPSTAVIGPDAGIIYPPMSHRVDYEAELAVVIKKAGWRVSREDALSHVLG